jgi:hypothetical protein
MSVMPAETLVPLLRETEAPLFVINLCASTTPVALTPPSTPELKRFNFFVTRQREDGRERFRLHMGYFASLDEAETVLAAVRDVYPAAWSGPAPNNRAAGARSRTAPAVATVAPATVQASIVPAAPLAAVEAAPVATVAPVEVKVAPAAPVVDTAAPVVPVPAVVEPVAAAPAALAMPAMPAAPAAPPVIAAPVPALRPESLEAMSNVREVLAELGDDRPREAATKPRKPARAAAAPPPAAKAVPQATANPAVVTPPLQAAKPETRVAPKPVAKPAPQPMPAAARDPAEALLTASQTLKVLETPAPFAEAGRAEGADIRVITPEDTQTLRDISLDAQNAAPPAFAVQLAWSVTPIDVDTLPHLAIFDAYTLYNVEGNRQGRRWYGLRLGFFTNPDAARQVAHYVRSDFTSVAVVPVTTRERDRASGVDPAAPAAPTASGSYAAPLARKPLPRPTSGKLEEPRSEVFAGFELLPDDRPAAVKRDVDDVATPPGTPPVLKPALRQPAKGAAPSKPVGKRAVARKPRPVVPGAPQPLEETLEMLGASTLTLDESREVIREPLGRDTPKKPVKGPGARFARLLTRLSNRG